MNALLIKENRDFPLIKDYHSNLQSSLSRLIFFPLFAIYGQPVTKKITNHIFYAKDVTEVKRQK